MLSVQIATNKIVHIFWTDSNTTTNKYKEFLLFMNKKLDQELENTFLQSKITSCFQIAKTTTKRHSSVRGFSRHHGGPIEGPPKLLDMIVL